jgi:hypothetical protein
MRMVADAGTMPDANIAAQSSSPRIRMTPVPPSEVVRPRWRLID